MNGSKPISGWFVIVRVAAGCGVALFNPLAIEFSKAADFHYFPDRARILAAILGGVIGMFNVVIMFLDGSFSRWRDQKQDAPPVPAQPTKPEGEPK